MIPLDSALTQALQQTFGLPSFRPWQEEAVQAVLPEGSRALVVAPTGGGKSLTYQFPATQLPGTTLVISPLIALMEDQVRALTERGIPATFLASSLSAEDRRTRESGLRQGRYKLVYIAPERLANTTFFELLQGLSLSLIAVDEAHCISQWGHDFRPEYLRVGEAIAALKPARLLACTATATPQVRGEICARLNIPDDACILRGFARPNLHLEAERISGGKDGEKRLLAALSDSLGDPRAPAGAAIVYAATRKGVEKAAAMLQRAGFSAAAYHAGLPAEVRTDVSERFASGRLAIVAATNAFGMGIDRSDIRLVVHLQPPGSIEAYYQEVGRAGRDGEPARGVLLASAADFGLRKRLLDRGDAAGPWSAHQWRLFLDCMRYVDAGSCRHDFILRYFGDEQEVLGGCGHCDVCLSPAQAESGLSPEDALTVVRQALSGVARVQGRAGLGTVCDMLRGQGSARVTRFGFERLSTFGLLSAYSDGALHTLLQRLIVAGLIDLSTGDYPVPLLTERGVAVMRGQLTLTVRLPPKTLRFATSGRKTRAARRGNASSAAAHASGAEPEALEVDETLYEALRATRRTLAQAAGTAAFVICHDRTLRELAAVRPQTLDALQDIHGIGPAKAEKYGAAFLSTLTAEAP